MVGGCGAGVVVSPDDQLSPRTLAAATHNALESRNHDALIGLISPPYRKPMRDVLTAMDDYAREADKTVALLARRVGPSSAARLENETVDFHRKLFPLPLQTAVQDNDVDWTRIDIREEQGAAWVHVDGLRSPFHKHFAFLFLDGAWFVEPLDRPEEFAAAARRMANNYKNATKTLKKLQTELRTDPPLTESDVNLRLWP